MGKSLPADHVVNQYIGSRLRALRQKHRMSLAALARMMRISYQQIQQYELGMCRMSAGTLYEFARIFNVPVSYFYDGLEDRERQPQATIAILETKRHEPLRVLLVEDNAGDEVLTREALGLCELPVAIDACRNGIEALEYLRKLHDGSRRPDIILLDLHIPKKDGMLVLADLKHDRELEDIPVIVLTNDLDPQILFEAYRRHASGFIKKSPTLEQFSQDLSLIVHYWSSMVMPSMQRKVA